MKSFNLFFCIFCFSSFLAGQNKEFISLEPEVIEIYDRSFYINEVEDLRPNRKLAIGFFMDPVTREKTEVYFYKSLPREFIFYFGAGLPKSEGLLPVQCNLNNIWLYDTSTPNGKSGKVLLDLSYLSKGKLIVRDTHTVVFEGETINDLFEPAIRSAIKLSLIRLHESEAQQLLTSNVSDQQKANPLTELAAIDKTTDPRYQRSKQRAINLGYMLGGHTILGVEYEALVTKHVGIWLGGGYLGSGDYVGGDFRGNGYGLASGGLGLRIHSKANNIRSPFLNVGYKRVIIRKYNCMDVRVGTYVRFRDNFGAVLEGGMSYFLGEGGYIWTFGAGVSF